MPESTKVDNKTAKDIKVIKEDEKNELVSY